MPRPPATDIRPPSREAFISRWLPAWAHLTDDERVELEEHVRAVGRAKAAQGAMRDRLTFLERLVNDPNPMIARSANAERKRLEKEYPKVNRAHRAAMVERNRVERRLSRARTADGECVGCP